MNYFCEQQWTADLVHGTASITLTFLLTNTCKCLLQQYLAFTEDLRLRCKVYERFQIQAREQNFLVITEDKWTMLNQRWSYVTQRTRVWQWKLDSNLPGRLGHIGDWLYRAEEMVESEIPYVDRHEDTAANINTKLDELKVSL